MTLFNVGDEVRLKRNYRSFKKHNMSIWARLLVDRGLINKTDILTIHSTNRLNMSDVSFVSRNTGQNITGFSLSSQQLELVKAAPKPKPKKKPKLSIKSTMKPIKR